MSRQELNREAEELSDQQARHSTKVSDEMENLKQVEEARDLCVYKFMQVKEKLTCESDPEDLEEMKTMMHEYKNQTIRLESVVKNLESLVIQMDFMEKEFMRYLNKKIATKSSEVHIDGDVAVVNRRIKDFAMKTVDVASDGNCLFNAVIASDPFIGETHESLRRQTIEMLKQDRTFYEPFMLGRFSSQMKNLSRDGYWSGEVGDFVIPALADVLQKRIIVHKPRWSKTISPKGLSDACHAENTIHIAHVNDNHYLGIVSFF
jgi:hypothetical protein